MTHFCLRKPPLRPVPAALRPPDRLCKRFDELPTCTSRPDSPFSGSESPFCRQTEQAWRSWSSLRRNPPWFSLFSVRKLFVRPQEQSRAAVSRPSSLITFFGARFLRQVSEFGSSRSNRIFWSSRWFTCELSAVVSKTGFQSAVLRTTAGFTSGSPSTF